MCILCIKEIGIALTNGFNNIIYYVSKPSTIFISNSGVIATVAVSGCLFPKETATALAGAVAIRGASWFTREIKDQSGLHIADLMSGLKTIVPTSVWFSYVDLAQTAARPQGLINNALEPYRGSTPAQKKLSWINRSFTTELISPIVEESIFRLGIQGGLSLGLRTVGVPEIAASFLAGIISASLFAGGHVANPNHPQYRETLISGIGFGLLMYKQGLTCAVVAHSANNAIVRALG